jgi:hypothetical protein
MPLVGIEPTTSVFKQEKIVFSLVRAATVMVTEYDLGDKMNATTMNSESKVKLFPWQAVEAYRVVRC